MGNFLYPSLKAVQAVTRKEREMTGWMGTILRIDLSRSKVTKEPLSQELAHDYIGGRGINARVLYSELKAGVHPLGPENKLLIGSGPCNGTLVP